jgi:hypothetical protein
VDLSIKMINAFMGYPEGGSAIKASLTRYLTHSHIFPSDALTLAAKRPSPHTVGSALDLQNQELK